MNGANGMSDIEGKAAMGSGERRGSGASFNTDFHRFLNANLKRPLVFLICVHPC
jgi:hypothetical protein